MFARIHQTWRSTSVGRIKVLHSDCMNKYTLVMLHGKLHVLNLRECHVKPGIGDQCNVFYQISFDNGHVFKRSSVRFPTIFPCRIRYRRGYLTPWWLDHAPFITMMKAIEFAWWSLWSWLTTLKRDPVNMEIIGLHVTLRKLAREVKSSIDLTCLFVVEDKQNYHHPLSSVCEGFGASFKPMVCMEC